MLRPIDTQTIYQQAPEVSHRQQAIQQGEEMQQTQFAQILKKEVDVQQETVTQVKENQKTDNDLEKRQKSKDVEPQKKYKKKKNKDKNKEDKEIQPVQHIDVKI